MYTWAQLQLEYSQTSELARLAAIDDCKQTPYDEKGQDHKTQVP